MRVELKRVRLTERFVKSATTGGRKSPIYMDDEVIGFGVQVRVTGRKLFPWERPHPDTSRSDHTEVSGPIGSFVEAG